MIKTFYDKGLAHASYAVLSGKELILIDPARDPQPYYDFATPHSAEIIGVIETHPHADFVSSHLEIHQRTGATVYINSLAGAQYPHQPFDEGCSIELEEYSLRAIHTPGHSPDSNTILLSCRKSGRPVALFTGDTLFVGDVGRPDLRESAGNIRADRRELARALYHSLRYKLMTFPDEVLVYPAHGPGSLCGRSMSAELSSTVGKEKAENYALAPMSEDAFVELIANDQPWMPKYFPHSLALNKVGAASFATAVNAPRPVLHAGELETGIAIVDCRPAEAFRNAHLPGAINVPAGAKFETWLGSIIAPQEPFYLLAQSEQALQAAMEKTAKIGYEEAVRGFVLAEKGPKRLKEFCLADFAQSTEDYTIVDIRHAAEVKRGKIFPHAIAIPLPELRERAAELPAHRPILVHCAGGTRSAMGASLIGLQFPDTEVLDMGASVKNFSCSTT